MKIRMLMPMLAAALVAACGGGGGEDASGGSDVADAYAGTWGLCQPTSASASSRLVFVVSKLGANAAAYTVTETRFAASTTCAGASTTGDTEAGTIAFKGARVLGFDTVNLTDSTVTADNDPATTEPRLEKDITEVTGNKLYFGGSTIGADGYPTTLNKSVGLTRQ